MTATPLDLGQKIALARERRLSSCTESAKGLFRRVYEGRATRNQSIKAMCLDCLGFDRAEIAVCGCYACPLWRYRPFQKRP